MIRKETFLLKIQYKLEYWLLKVCMKLFVFFGMYLSGLFVGTLGVIIGIFTSPSFMAYRNLKHAFPKLTRSQIIKIIIGMWNNLGRNIAEYPNIYNKKLNVFDYAVIDETSEKILKSIKKDKRGAILFSGHLGNWEVGLRILKELKIPVKTVYRPLNNRLADELTNGLRERIGVEMIPKGGKGALRIIRELKKGTKIVMLVDQRLSNGIKIPFFKRPALTTDVLGAFGLKYNLPIYPVRIVRKKGANNFEFRVEEELKIKKTNNFKRDVKKVARQMNKKLEEWIKECPEQWFWVHDRWRL